MKSLRFVRLIVSTNGQVQFHPEQQLRVVRCSVTGKLHAPIGEANIPVQETWGLQIPEEGAVFGSFLPLFNHYGEFRGLVVADAICDAEPRPLLVVTEFSCDGLVPTVETTMKFCGSFIFTPNRKHVGAVSIVRPNSELAIYHGGSRSIWCYDGQNLLINRCLP